MSTRRGPGFFGGSVFTLYDWGGDNGNAETAGARAHDTLHEGWAVGRERVELLAVTRHRRMFAEMLDYMEAGWSMLRPN